MLFEWKNVVVCLVRNLVAAAVASFPLFGVCPSALTLTYALSASLSHTRTHTICSGFKRVFRMRVRAVFVMSARFRVASSESVYYKNMTSTSQKTHTYNNVNNIAHTRAAVAK